MNSVAIFRNTIMATRRKAYSIQDAIALRRKRARDVESSTDIVKDGNKDTVSPSKRARSTNSVIKEENELDKKIHQTAGSDVSSNRSYWLMKAEPNDVTLEEIQGKEFEPWDGGIYRVRFLFCRSHLPLPVFRLLRFLSSSLSLSLSQCSWLLYCIVLYIPNVLNSAKPHCQQVHARTI